MQSNGKGTRTVDSYHRELGRIMWNECGMSRTESGLKEALQKIPALHQEFRENVSIPGDASGTNPTLEKAGRVDDFFELAALMCQDALDRNESCGGHFREESQTEEGEALRDDENYTHVAAYEYKGAGQSPERHVEPLEFEEVELTQRSYK